MLSALKRVLQPARLMQLIRFGAVGVCATAIYFSVAMALIGAKLNILVAHLIAYAISILVSYFGQKIFTFGVRGDHKRVGPRFIIATIAIATLQFGLVAFLKRSGAADFAIICVSTVFYPIASFFVHTFWTFKTPANGRGSAP